MYCNMTKGRNPRPIYLKAIDGDKAAGGVVAARTCMEALVPAALGDSATHHLRLAFFRKG